MLFHSGVGRDGISTRPANAGVLPPHEFTIWSFFPSKASSSQLSPILIESYLTLRGLKIVNQYEIFTEAVSLP